MPKKKEIQITADLLSRCLHSLGELGVDYAVVIKGTHALFSNVDREYAMTILRDELQIQDKLDDIRAEDIAQRLDSIPPEQQN